MPTNDNDPPPQGLAPTPDPHGQAALLLVESLIHGLIARSIISNGDAIEIVDTAGSVQVEIARAADGAGAPMWRCHALLSAIGNSMKLDDPGSTPPPHPGS